MNGFHRVPLCTNFLLLFLCMIFVPSPSHPLQKVNGPCSKFCGFVNCSRVLVGLCCDWSQHFRVTANLSLPNNTNVKWLICTRKKCSKRDLSIGPDHQQIAFSGKFCMDVALSLSVFFGEEKKTTSSSGEKWFFVSSSLNKSRSQPLGEKLL